MGRARKAEEKDSVKHETIERLTQTAPVESDADRALIRAILRDMVSRLPEPDHEPFPLVQPVLGVDIGTEVET